VLVAFGFDDDGMFHFFVARTKIWKWLVSMKRFHEWGYIFGGMECATNGVER
jgi:hypothetical protein